MLCLYSIFYEKIQNAYETNIGVFQLFSRKEMVFHAQFLQNFHGKSGIFTDTFKGFFTHGWIFFTGKKTRIFTEGFFFTGRFITVE